MWTVIDGATYQHIFAKLDDPFEWKGELVQWSSACGRSFAIKEPQPNPKKKKCKYCLEKENGHHVREQLNLFKTESDKNARSSA